MENQRLFDRHVEHLVRSRLHAKELLEAVNSAAEDHQSRVLRLFRRDETEKLRLEISRYVEGLKTTVGGGLTDFLDAELTFQASSASRAVGRFYEIRTPSRQAVARKLLSQPIRFPKVAEEGPSILNGFDRLGSAELVRLNREVRQGIVAGKTREQIEDRLTRVSSVTANQARTLTSTGFTYAEELASREFWEENQDVLAGYTFTAILDAATTEICASNDGTFVEKDDYNMFPPLHWNCRSSLAPVLKDYRQLLDIDSPRVNQEALIETPPNLFDGGMPARETFEVWLRRQTFEKQKELLGSEEAVSLFQRGNLRLREFFSHKANAMSLGTLRKLDAQSSFRSSSDRPLARDPELRLTASRPSELVRSKDQAAALRTLISQDVLDSRQSISLTDYRGTSLAGKRTSRRRSYNELDERTTSFDPFTGEVKSSWYYDPDYALYTTRLDLVRNSKTLTRTQRDWIIEFVEGLGDNVSTNQKSSIAEALRVTFERAARDPTLWSSYTRVFRAEMNYSVVNVSRLLDTRSRERSVLFQAFGPKTEPPKVQILGEYVSFDDLMNNKLRNQNFVRDWDKTTGRELARRLYYPSLSDSRLGRLPLRAYLLGYRPKPKGPPKELVRWVEKNIPGVSSIKFGELKFSNVVASWINKIPGVKEYRDFWNWWKTPTEPLLQQWRRKASAQVQAILDLQFLRMRDRRTLTDRAVTAILNDDDNIRHIQGLMKTIASGFMTDYDGLAIALGKELYKTYRPIRPWYKPTLQDYHADGSSFLEALQRAGIIRVQSRGVIRRSTLDLDTGRLGGNWKDTVSREVIILDPDLLALQKASRKVVIANRIGVVNESQRYYVVPGKKTYVDARGQDTGVPIITRSAAPFYDEKLITREIADMLNHTMATRYRVDDDFASFFLDLARYRDVRGRAGFYDDINAFRHEILKRGELGFGLLETLRYHLGHGKAFSVHARIDG